MALITVDELREESNLPSRNIDLSNYSDVQLQRKIDWVTSYIQKGSSRYFAETIFTQSEVEYYGSSIFLEKTPVTSIETFKINGRDVEEDTYILHRETGEIEFINTNPREFTYTITYIVSEDPEGDITMEAMDICMDLIFIKLRAPTGGSDIKSFKSGNTTVNYEQDDPMDEIDKRIAAIKKSQAYFTII